MAGYYGNYQPANPVAAAIETYKSVDDIFETSRQRKIADEERALQRARQEEQDRRSAIQFDQQSKQFDWQAQDRARTEQIRTATDNVNETVALQELSRAADPYRDNPQALNAFYGNVAKTLKSSGQEKLLTKFMDQNHLDADTIISAREELGGLIADVNKAVNSRGQIDPATKQRMLGSFNNIAGQFINQGGVDHKIIDPNQPFKKSISDFRITPDGRVAFQIAVDGMKDGNSQRYYSWLTEGRDANPNAKMRLVDPSDLLDRLYKVDGTLEAAESIRIHTGDKDAIERAKKRAENERTTQIIGDASTLYDPKAPFDKNFTNMFTALTQKHKGADPAVISAAVTNFISMQKMTNEEKRASDKAILDNAETRAKTKLYDAQASAEKTGGKDGGNIGHASRMKVKDLITDIDNAYNALDKAREGGDQFAMMDDSQRNEYVAERKKQVDVKLSLLRKDGYLDIYSEYVSKRGYKPPAAPQEDIDKLVNDVAAGDDRATAEFYVWHGYTPSNLKDLVAAKKKPSSQAIPPASPAGQDTKVPKVIKEGLGGFYQSMKLSGNPVALAAGNQKWGGKLRPDGTPKGDGWLGPISMTDGSGEMTELTIGVQIDGKETNIPSIVPTLTKEEVKFLADGNELKRGDKVSDSIVRKATEHALKRIREGKSPYVGDNEPPMGQKTTLSNPISAIPSLFPSVGEAQPAIYVKNSTGKFAEVRLRSQLKDGDNLYDSRGKLIGRFTNGEIARL